ncbi:MAG: HD domain-containing protein [Actinobacteria bacterium]|nr:HD domain-containing protein [Actinomycetota bacterium]
METGKKQFISDLEAGARADSIFMVAKKQVRKKKNGDDYCAVTLQDKEGSIEGVAWTEIYRSAGNFTEGDLVSVEGDVKEYKQVKQLVINSIKKIENKEDIEYSDYIKTSRRDIDEMFAGIKEYAARIKNPHLKKLIDSYFEDKEFVKDFKNAAAAVRYHHAFKGGLLEHTLAVTEICDAISRVYHNLNYDLLISGAILHDIGKIREYKTVATTEVTDEGKLLGHITIGYGWVLEKIKQIDGFPGDLRDRLLHIILSHHGHKEFGSPKRPKILEAFIVYYVDHMDADIGGYNIILEENKGGSDWSDYVKNFERSVFLKKLELPGDEDSEDIKRVVDGKLDRDNTKTCREEKQQEELF